MAEAKKEKKEAKKETKKAEKKDVKEAPKKEAVGKKDAKAAEKKEAKPREKREKKSRKVIVKKDKETTSLRTKIIGKDGKPVFRGRFGKRTIRKKSKAKWNKWRYPRGIDVKHEVCEGFNPKEGYRTPRAIRHVHPSGFREETVRTLGELNAVEAKKAVRIDAKLGKKKKAIIVEKAIEKGIKVLNP